MKSPQYNLLDEPWLPVRLADGSVRSLGLLEVMRRSGDITALAETEPPSLIAEYRLLLAIVHRALVRSRGSWKDSDRVKWFREGLPVEDVCSYLETWRERFWLFHPEHPFMQVAALATAEETRDKRKPWTQVSLASPTGNNPVLFEHVIDEAPGAVPAPRAFAHMLGYLQFTASGLVKCLRAGADKAGPLVNAAAVLPIGSTLGQTLVLALHEAPSSGQIVGDLPAWEQAAPAMATLSGDAILATGANDRYTRLTRAVLLEQLEDGAVAWIRFSEGIQLEEDEQAPDPMVCFRMGQKSLVKVGFDDGRDSWRDLPSLLPFPADGYAPAAVMQSAARLARSLGNAAQCAVLVGGVVGEPGKMKLLRWRLEQFPLPQALLAVPDRARELRVHMALAEDLHRSLRSLTTDLVAGTLPDPKSKDTRSRARELVERGPFTATYFAAAERELWALMECIAADDSDAANALWQRTLADAARLAWRRLLGLLGASARVLQAEARCASRLNHLLRQQLPAAHAPVHTPATVETVTQPLQGA
ncbi:MAG: type I-E CRISPR-associated protein Cse1/CasA [Roseateles asaccharophilus]|uniref:type I-E CRISPR-associated protein Cse1/CasA n=1 Tax=Roseateles asaccharophilus TaxID=582607 RepID=UPI00391A6B55